MPFVSSTDPVEEVTTDPTKGFRGNGSNLKLSVRYMIIGAVVGLGLGILFAHVGVSDIAAQWISLPGDLFLRAVNSLVVPYVFCSVAVAVGDIVFVGKVSIVGLQTLKIFATGWVVSTTLGIAVALMFRPMFQLKNHYASPDANAYHLLVQHDGVVGGQRVRAGRREQRLRDEQRRCDHRPDPEQAAHLDARVRGAGQHLLLAGGRRPAVHHHVRHGAGIHRRPQLLLQDPACELPVPSTAATAQHLLLGHGVGHLGHACRRGVHHLGRVRVEPRRCEPAAQGLHVPRSLHDSRSIADLGRVPVRHLPARALQPLQAHAPHDSVLPLRVRVIVVAGYGTRHAWLRPEGSSLLTVDRHLRRVHRRRHEHVRLWMVLPDRSYLLGRVVWQRRPDHVPTARNRLSTICNVNDDIMALKVIAENTDETVAGDQLGQRN
ncbi:hypothetical protein ON010_g18312 [Phytophthora cinnamomi]|nr:hypothetical protein ON010_g18312 [Phytophthora cinnamomi]